MSKIRIVPAQKTIPPVTSCEEMNEQTDIMSVKPFVIRRLLAICHRHPRVAGGDMPGQCVSNGRQFRGKGVCRGPYLHMHVFVGAHVCVCVCPVCVRYRLEQPALKLSSNRPDQDLNPHSIFVVTTGASKSIVGFKVS